MQGSYVKGSGRPGMPFRGLCLLLLASRFHSHKTDLAPRLSSGVGTQSPIVDRSLSFPVLWSAATVVQSLGVIITKQPLTLGEEKRSFSSSKEMIANQSCTPNCNYSNSDVIVNHADLCFERKPNDEYNDYFCFCFPFSPQKLAIALKSN